MKAKYGAYKIALPVILFGLLAGGIGFGLSARFTSETQAEELSGVVCETPQGVVAMKNQPETSLKSSGVIPPIDAAAPVRTETATFALG
jgi:hypothetical protein